MALLTACPVCGRECDDAGRDHCPQCNAEWTCFRLLEALPESATGTLLPPAGGRQTLMLAALSAVLALALAVGLWQVRAVTSAQLSELGMALVRLEDSVERLGSDVRRLSVPPPPELVSAPTASPVAPPTATLPELVPVAPAVPAPAPDAAATPATTVTAAAAGDSAPPATLAYDAREDDTLWEIAERFYGHGRYYPVLLALSPEAGIYDIGTGVSLRILTDRRRAAAVYAELCRVTGPRLTCRFALRPDDTPERVAARFFRADDVARRTAELRAAWPENRDQRIDIEMP
ncbi:MAG: hypothetical protein HYV63_08680 [Candidatus Schekmanbacteria bacterium]|nr:hypothetical protein [Candidatus Schekmanbacteria bacterium]